MLPRVLVVDDDDWIREALILRLKSSGYEVLVGYDGVSAVKQAVQGHPDLILMDVFMPAGHGISVAEKLRQRPETAGIPFMYMTASQRPGLQDELWRQGPVAIFEKPFDTAEIIRRIDEVLGRVPAGNADRG